MWALLEKGIKVKEAASLPTIDGSMPVMDTGFEWIEINDGAKPAFDQVTEELVATEKKQGGKWKKTYAKQMRSDASKRSVETVQARFTDLLRKNQEPTILAIVRSVRGVETAEDIALLNKIISNAVNAESLVAKAKSGEAHDRNSGWAE